MSSDTVFGKQRREREDAESEPPSKRSKNDTNNNHNHNNLPIHACKHELLSIINNADHDVIIITGDTGSGKSTQLCQMLYDCGQYDSILITQPRRIGAISLARRVAKERHSSLGDLVGFRIRFHDCCSQYSTKIRYVTDGILLRELMSSRRQSLLSYDAIILDEAHERSLQTDILFALLKQQLQTALLQKPHRKPFKLLVTSATLNVDKFVAYFRQPLRVAAYHIEGRCFPVQTFHCTVAQKDYVSACIDTILQIHVREAVPGDILCFLTGQREIESACEWLSQRMDALMLDDDDAIADCVILPAYSALSYPAQQRIFARAPPNCRKIIFATNVAETSLTVDGIRFVVDAGLVKQELYNAETRMDELVVANISQSSAVQRQGRAGRTAKGQCYRLYTARELGEFEAETMPEMLRVNLCSTILTLKVCGVDDVLRFDYLDAPKEAALMDALHSLFLLDAIDASGALVEQTGTLMSKLPLSPLLSKLLLTCIQEHDEIALNLVSIIAAQTEGSSYGDLFTEASKCHALFESKYGDVMSWLLVCNHFYALWSRQAHEDGDGDDNDRVLSDWCTQHFVHFKTLKLAMKIRTQLQHIIKKEKICQAQSSSSSSSSSASSSSTLQPMKAIRKALAQTLFMQSAVRLKDDENEEDEDGKEKRLVFRTYGNGDFADVVYIHPSSSLPLSNGAMAHLKWIVYLELTYSSKPYMKGICVVRFEWIKKLLPKIANRIEWRRIIKTEVVETELELEQHEPIRKSNTAIDRQDLKNRYLQRKKLKTKLKCLRDSST